MPFRFNRRVPTPFGRVNLSKSGVSLTEGVPGAHLTVGRRGVRASLGLVGSGFGWFTTIPWTRGRRSSPTAPSAPLSAAQILVRLAIVIGVLALLAWRYGGG
jgi:hypothetical protein